MLPRTALLSVVSVAVPSLLWAISSMASPSPAHACSCRPLPIEVAFLRASIVAEVEILDVAAHADLDFEPQPIVVRVVRVFTAPRGIREGMTLTVLYDGYGCSASPVPPDAVGRRAIELLRMEGQLPVLDYCAPRLSRHVAIPAFLEEARRRWLAAR